MSEIAVKIYEEKHDIKRYQVLGKIDGKDGPNKCAL